MNAHGISVFYGATSTTTAIAEVRPPVGSRTVVATFNLLKPIRLLNLNALENILTTDGSIFDEAYIDEIKKSLFIRQLRKLMSTPVMPERENLDYLLTQVIADYLSASEELNIDGILFPSVQTNDSSMNVILFRKSSKVAPQLRPKNATFEVHTGHSDEDGWVDDYYVSIDMTEVEEMEEDDIPANNILDPLMEANFEYTSFNAIDDRENTLSIDPKSLTVHHINAAIFETDDHEVSSHKWNRKDMDF